VLRVLLRPRSIALVVVAILVATLFVRLGQWQWGKHERRDAEIAAVQADAERAPIPLEDASADASSWTRVRTSGVYDTEHQVLLRYRPVGGEPGVHVLVPLRTADGRAVLVDRGFLRTADPARIPTVPAPPVGTVDVVGRLRPSEPGGLSRDEGTDSIRRVDLDALDEELPYPLFPRWLQVVSEDPSGDAGLEPLPPPSLDRGPYLSYGVQWWLFAVVGLVGVVILLRNESRHGKANDSSSADADEEAVTG